MAREERDREDLIAEATALVLRVKLGYPDAREAVVAGFRRDGSLSIYFEPERVYHFTASGHLRRAYVGGLLYKAVGGRLASLRRERSAASAVLARRDLGPAEEREFLTELAAAQDALRTALDEGRVEVLRQVPADGAVADRLRQWLANQPAPIKIARSPRDR